MRQWLVYRHRLHSCILSYRHPEYQQFLGKRNHDGRWNI